MKIIQSIHGLDSSSGGPSVSVTDLSDQFVYHGHNVKLISTRGNQNGSRIILPQEDAISVHFFNRNIFKLMNLNNSEYKKMFKLIHQFSPDIIHDNSIWLPFNNAIAKIARNQKIPRIVSVRGTLQPYAFKQKHAKKLLVWHLYQKADLKSASVIHATSEEEADAVLNFNLNVPVAIIPNGIKLSRSMLKSQCADNHQKNRTILFLGRLHPIKGLDNLIMAWSALRPKDWKLLVAGSGEQKYVTALENRVQSLGLSDVVKFVGEVDQHQKKLLFRDSEVLILPSYSENYGLVVAEALNASIPVLTTRGTPWKSLLQFKCGWWIDIGVEPLIYELQKVLNMSPEQLRTMGKNGHVFAQSHLGCDITAKKMLQVYDWVKSKGVKPDFIFL